MTTFIDTANRHLYDGGAACFLDVVQKLLQLREQQLEDLFLATETECLQNGGSGVSSSAPPSRYTNQGDPMTDTALLLLDFQDGLGDQDWAAHAVRGARKALDSARSKGITVIFSRVSFLPGYTDVARSNMAFWPYAENDLLPPDASSLVSGFAPQTNETVVLKNRCSPFAGSSLSAVLRAQSVSHLVLAGISTSGVVLAAFTEGENTDFRMTVLSDACADPDEELYDTLVQKLFPRSAAVMTVAEWLNE